MKQVLLSSLIISPYMQNEFKFVDHHVPAPAKSST